MLRDDVLLLLTEAEGYVSGEEMREKLGVTRAAVSQAVRAQPRPRGGAFGPPPPPGGG